MVPRPSRTSRLEGPHTNTKELPWIRNALKVRLNRPRARLKELAGKAVGNKKLQARGKAEEAGGKVRSAVGGLKDAMRGK